MNPFSTRLKAIRERVESNNSEFPNSYQSDIEFLLDAVDMLTVALSYYAKSECTACNLEYGCDDDPNLNPYDDGKMAKVALDRLEKLCEGEEK